MSDPLLGAGKVTLIPAPHQVRIDYAGGTEPVYVGYADRGIATSDNEWYILKLTYSGSDVVLIQSVNNGIWDNRTTETYS